MTTHHDASPSSDRGREAQNRWPTAFERVAACVTVGAIGAIFLNYVGSRLTFFGAPVVIDAEEVRNYWIAVAVLSASVVGSFVAAAWRRATKAFVWHGLMALTGLVVSMVFAVTQTGAPDSFERDPQPRDDVPSHNSVCHSGGDSDECPGG